MKKLLAKQIIKVIKGIFDAIAPNIKASLKETEYDPKLGMQKTKVDWVRIVAAGITFILLVLNFFGLVDIVNFIQNLISELSNNLPG
mgnify:CR=1 FL=1|jgi:hypothetical protein